MPPKKDAPSLDAQQTRKVMKELRIEFLGPCRLWPLRFADRFKEIFEMYRVDFEDLPGCKDRSEDGRPCPPATALKARVLKLKQSFKPPGDDPLDESTLRSNTEHLVFSRFSNEVKCKTCSKFLMLSEVQSLPCDPAEVNQGVAERKRGNICRCSADKRTDDGFDDKGETLLFGSFSSQPVCHDKSEYSSLTERGVRERCPDRVYALRATNSITHFAAEFDSQHAARHARHSPFTRSGLFYPFVIVEAKGEDSCSGLEAIQRQTAFPIRTCLKLQQDLQQASGQPLDPLVWFFTYQADLFTVSACVVNDGKYQVFDLWINRVRAVNGALQLLRIVDCIADWARDTYRLEILSCLAGGIDRVLCRRGDSVNTYASRSSEQRALAKVSHLSTGPDLGSRNATQSSSDDPDENDILMEDSSPAAYSGETEETEEPASHPFLRWMTPYAEQQDTLAADLTFRHSNMVMFNFVHLSVPENAKELVDVLSQIAKPENIRVQEAAHNLWASISSQATSLPSSASRIEKIKTDWLRLIPTASSTEDIGVRALFKFRSVLRRKDWQVVRDLTCISCTYLAAQKLASLAGIRHAVSLEWAQEPMEFPTAIFDALRCLTARSSATAAVVSITIYLRPSRAPVRPIWVLESKVDEGTKSTFRWSGEPYRSTLAPMLDIDDNRMAIIPKPTPVEIRKLFMPSAFPDVSAALLHIENHGSRSLIPWCLMVFEEMDFQSDREMGRLLARVEAKREAFVLTAQDPLEGESAVTKLRLEPSMDRSCFNWWIQKLLA